MTDQALLDDDLVYVDPDRRLVVGKVEFAKNGNPKPLQMPAKEDAVPVEGSKGKEERKFRGKPRKRFYPWGTYRTMKKVYRLEGRVLEEERQITLDQAIEKSMKEPFWD